jgi:hypothetical protein
MNYGEEIAYWYLRMNGFFPITNFVIHRSSEVRNTSDCDILAIRLPHVYEEIGGNPGDWDKELVDGLGFAHIIGLICEVKTGDYKLEEIFRPEYVKYSLGRLGLIPREMISGFAEKFFDTALLETEEGHLICKLLIANIQKDSQVFFNKSLNSAVDFIENRILKYPKEKYSDRMFFGSELLQYTIHRINRERERQNTPRIEPKPGPA